MEYLMIIEHSELLDDRVTALQSCSPFMAEHIYPCSRCNWSNGA